MKRRNQKRYIKPIGICCPKCGNEMDAVPGTKRDAVLSNVFFGAYRIGQFRCYGCFWEQRVTLRINTINKRRYDNSIQNSSPTLHYVSK